MGLSLRKPKVLSIELQRFAESIVESAGVLDQDTAQILVQAFASVPRERFVGAELRSRAYQADENTFCSTTRHGSG